MHKDKSPKALRTALAAAGITTVCAVSHAITKTLVSVAVDRDLPHNDAAQEKASGSIPKKVASQAIAKFTGSKENEPFRDAARSASVKLRDTPHTVVEITADDGNIMKGHWFPVENANRIIIAMHGWRSSWSRDFGMISEFFEKNRCSVLYPEQRGQGSSGGEYMGLGILERYDCRSWIEWVNNNNLEAVPIYLMGISMGATTVLMASGLELPKNVRGIIADCGFTSPQEISKHVVEDNLHISFGLRGKVADDLCRKKNQVGIRSCSTQEVLAKNNIPVLFIHGADDSFVPVSMTYENYKACAAPKELLIVPGADHAMSYYAEREKYEQAVIAFWNKYS